MADARLTARCPGCGTPHVPGQKFCAECGAAFVETGGPRESSGPAAYTPKHLAEKILTSKAALEGERKQVTVLFCDIADSTPIAERVGADAMVGKALEMWNDATWVQEAESKCPKLVKRPIADIDEVRALVSEAAPAMVGAIDAATRDRLETELLRRGDDGLLEHLLYYAEEEAPQDKRLAGVLALTGGLLYRRLFKLIGRCRSACPNALDDQHTWRSRCRCSSGRTR